MSPAARSAARSVPHRIRIIGGQWKRTPITVLERPGLRPTPDRVRETLFNWIGPAIKGRRVLDLFAGTGALGFEAASRGAAEVVMVEPDSRARAQIQALLERLSADQISMVSNDALTYLSRLAANSAAFDLVLLDPPFGAGWLPKVVPLLARRLAPGAFLYLEAEQALDQATVQSWLGEPAVVDVRCDRAGQVYYHLFEIES